MYEKVHAYFQDDAEPVLNEMHYKDIMGEILPNNVAGQPLNKLPFRDWAPLIPFVKYQGYKQNVMKFFVPNKFNGWETYIMFDEWTEQMQDANLKAPEVARLLLWGGNLRLHCGCPSFSFWGFEYICTQLDAAIIPEVRYPHIRNPELKGICCKHLIRTLKVLPFHLGSMASAIVEQRRALGIHGAQAQDPAQSGQDQPHDH
jgi:hypothetical protein